MKLKIGDKAPEFTSVDENGNEIKLTDYKGKKVVLYFYPKRQFCKNHCFLDRKLLFFWFGVSTNPPKLDAQTR